MKQTTGNRSKEVGRRFAPSRKWFAVAVGFLSPTFADAADEKITYVDHVLPIMENKCFSCHNPDKKKGGLDLSTYSAAMAGGSGGSIAEAGNPDGSRLHLTTTKKEEPFMPPEGDPLPSHDLDIIKKWIEGGLLETKSSVAKKGNVSGVDLTVVASTGGKPENPSLPQDILLEPVVTTPRGPVIGAMAASRWAPVFAVAGQKQILFYTISDGELAGILPYPEGVPESLSFSPNGSLLVAGGGRGGKAGNVIVFDVESGDRVAEIGREFDSVLAADISADHSLVSLGGPSKKVKTFSTVTGEEIYSIKKHTDWVLSLAYSPDGILLATGDRNGGMFVWEAENGGEFYTLNGHSGPINGIAWRSDSNVLASAGEDGTVRLWAMSNGKEIKKWAAHGGGVLSIAFAPDGKIVTAGRDKLIKVWDGAGKQLVATAAQADIVTKVAFAHDSGRFLSGDWTGEVRMWNVADGKQVAGFVSNPPSIASRIASLEVSIPTQKAKAEAENAALSQIVASVQSTQAELSKAQGELAKVRTSKEVETGAMKQAEALVAAAKAKQTASAKANTAALEAQKKIAEITGRLKPVEAELVSVDGTIKAKEAEVAAAKKALDEAAALHASKLAELEAEKKKRSEVAARIEGMRKEMPPAPDMEKIAGELAAAGEEIKAAQGLFATKQKAVQELTANEAALDQKTKSLAPKLEAAKKSEIERKAVADREMAILAKLERSLPKWKAAQFNVGVIAAREERDRIEGELAERMQAADEASSALAAVHARIATGRQMQVEAPATIANHEARVAQFGKEVVASESQMAAAKSAVASIQGKRDGIASVISVKQAHLVAIAEVQRLGTDLAQKAKMEQAAAAQIASTKGKLDEARKQVSTLEAKMREHAPVLAAKEREMTAAQAELANAQQERDALGARIAQIKAATDLRNQQIAASAEVQRLQGQLSPMDQEIASKDAARVEAESRLAVVRENQEAMAVESRKKEQVTQQVAGVVTELETSTAEMRKQKSAVEARVAELRRAVANKKKEVQSKSVPAANPKPKEEKGGGAPTSGGIPPSAKPSPATLPLPNPPPASPAKPAAPTPAAPTPAAPTPAAPAPATPAPATPAPPKPAAPTQKPAAPTPATPVPPKPATPATPATPTPVKPVAPVQQPPAPAKPPVAPPAPLTPQQELERLQAALVAAEKQLAEANAKVLAQENALKAKRAEMEKEKAELARLQAALAEAPKAVAAAEGEVKKNQDAVNAALAAKAAVEQQLAAQRKKVEDLEKQYKTMQPK